MFQKIKNIKKYIRMAKIGGVIFAVIFVLHLALSCYMMFRIAHLQELVDEIAEYQLTIPNE